MQCLIVILIHELLGSSWAVGLYVLFSDKKKVLRHHPDKRRARGLEVKEGEDDYFTCITRGKELPNLFVFF